MPLRKLAAAVLRRAPLPAPPTTKSSATAPLIALHQTGRPVWSPRDYAAFAREGYARNPVVYRAVRMISESAASVPIRLFDGTAEIAEHPLLDLLAGAECGVLRSRFA